MSKSQLPTPHDNFFYFTFSHPQVAQPLVKAALPPGWADQFKMSNLTLEPASFVDANLRSKQADLLFSFDYQPLEPNEKTGLLTGTDVGTVDQRSRAKPIQRRGHVYFLIEHKSDPDHYTVMQLLGYQMRILERLRRKGEPVDPVVANLIYHGERKWRAPISMEDLVPYPDGLEAYQIKYSPQIIDLSQIDDVELANRFGESPILQNTFKLLKYIRSSSLVEYLPSILVGLAQAQQDTERQIDISLWVHTIGVYVMAVNKEIGETEFGNIVTDVFPTQIEPGSLADRLLKRGREEGIEKGLLVGRVQTLQELLDDPVTPATELRERLIEELTSLVNQLQLRIRERDL